MSTSIGEQISLDRMRGMRKHLRELLDHPGWAVFSGFVAQKQTAIVQELVLKPLENMDAAFGQEYRKGQYAAWDACLNEPEAWLESLQSDIERLAAIEAAEAQQKAKEPAHAMASSEDEPVRRIDRSP